MGLARSRNIDLGTMGSFAGSLYQSTGMNGKGATDFAASIIGTSHNTKQMVSILDGVAKLLKSQEQRQGSLLGSAESKAMAGLFSLNFGKSPLLQNGALYDKANSAIAAGGQNPGEQLYWWKMAGGDNYKGGFDQLLSIQAEQRKGIFSKTLRDNLKRDLSGKSRGQQLATVQTMMGLNSDPRDKNSEGALFLDNVLMSNIDFNDETSLKKALGNSPNAQKIISAMAMSKTLSNAQQREQLDARVGGKLTPTIQKLEEQIIKTTGSLLDYFEGKGGKSLPGIGKNLFTGAWDAGAAGKILDIGAIGAAGYGVKKVIRTGRAGVRALVPGSALADAAVSGVSRRLPFFGQTARYLKFLGKTTGAVSGVALDWAFPDEAGGEGQDTDRVKSFRGGPRDPAVSKKPAVLGDLASELQAANVTLAMILTLLSGVINIGGTNAQGAGR